MCFFINHLQLHEETSLMRPESCSKPQSSDRNLEAPLILRPFIRITVVGSSWGFQQPWFLATTMPGISFLPWDKPSTRPCRHGSYGYIFHSGYYCSLLRSRQGKTVRTMGIPIISTQTKQLPGQLNLFKANLSSGARPLFYTPLRKKEGEIIFNF